MGNNICSVCSSQTNITSINQLSLSSKKHNRSKLINKKLKQKDSTCTTNKNETVTSLNEISINQEINYAKQSQYDFKNLIYLVNKRTKNIIKEHLNNKTKINDELKELYFIDTHEDYKKYKKYGIFPIKENELKEVGIPKEIYEEKGLNYIRKKNHLEVLFIHDMKMVKIYDELKLNNIEDNNFSNNLNKNLNHNIIHINNINNIVTFAKEKSEENNKFLKLESYNKDNLKTDFPSLCQRKASDITNITLTHQNKNTETLEVYSNSTSYHHNSMVIQSSKKKLDSELIFQILFLLVVDEVKIAKCLKSKIQIDNIYSYYLINNSWLEEFKKIFNYRDIYKIYTNFEKNKDNINMKISKEHIKKIIKRNPNILKSIKTNLNNYQLFADLNNVKQLRHGINDKQFRDGEKLTKISIPYDFGIINRETLDLIINFFNFKCPSRQIHKNKESICEFCESNFLKEYECYIGNETIFFYDNDKSSNLNYYYVSIFRPDECDNISNLSMRFLFLFENKEILKEEINKYFHNITNLKDYFKIKDIDKHIIIQNIYDNNQDHSIGKILNIKLLLKKNEENDIKRKSQIENNKKKKSQIENDIDIKKVASNFNGLFQKPNLKRKSGKRKWLKNQPLLLYTKPPLIGLNRSGQPFFFNPLLQCLSNIPELTNFFLFNSDFFNDENAKKIYPFSYQYSQLISKLWRKPAEDESEINNYPYYERSFQPFEIKQYLSSIDSSVLIQQKNMFRELFLFIIKILDNELNNFKSSFKKIKNNKKDKNDNNSIIEENEEIDNINDENESEDNSDDNSSERKSSDESQSISSRSSSSSSDSSSTENEEILLQKFRKDFYGKNNSIIQQNFYSEIQVSYQCLTCNLYKFHYEIINSFTFDLEKIKKNIMSKYKLRDVMKKTIVLSLSDCFENEEKPSSFEINLLCEKCNLKTFEKQIRLIKAPNILVVFFKEKDIFQVEFDISLDFQMNPFIHDKLYESAKEEDDLESRRNSYYLICILCSPNDSTRKSTYLTYCKNPVNNLWYCYNDSIVNSVDVNQFLKTVKVPKLLIYRKKESIILYFKIDKNELFDLEVSIDIVFKNVLSYLYVKYTLIKDMDIKKFYYNHKEIDINKTVSQNNLIDEAIIFCYKESK